MRNHYRLGCTRGAQDRQVAEAVRVMVLPPRGGARRAQGIPRRKRELFQSDHFRLGRLRGERQVQRAQPAEYQSLDRKEFDFFAPRFSYLRRAASLAGPRASVLPVRDAVQPRPVHDRVRGCGEEAAPPGCVHPTRDEVEKMAHFVCAECTKHHMKKGKHRPVCARARTTPGWPFREETAHGRRGLRGDDQVTRVSER